MKTVVILLAILALLVGGFFMAHFAMVFGVGMLVGSLLTMYLSHKSEKKAPAKENKAHKEEEKEELWIHDAQRNWKAFAAWVSKVTEPYVKQGKEVVVSNSPFVEDPKELEDILDPRTGWGIFYWGAGLVSILFILVHTGLIKVLVIGGIIAAVAYPFIYHYVKQKNPELVKKEEEKKE